MDCDHKKKDGLPNCPKCGADLSLCQEEIDARDSLFAAIGNRFLEICEKSGMKGSRRAFDTLMDRNGARFSMWILDAAKEYSGSKPKAKRRKKMTKLEIEEEKLKILGEIRDKM